MQLAEYDNPTHGAHVAVVECEYYASRYLDDLDIEHHKRHPISTDRRSDSILLSGKSASDSGGWRWWCRGQRRTDDRVHECQRDPMHDEWLSRCGRPQC
jgi:hypothetical protein